MTHGLADLADQNLLKESLKYGIKTIHMLEEKDSKNDQGF